MKYLSFPSFLFYIAAMILLGQTPAAAAFDTPPAELQAHQMTQKIGQARLSKLWFEVYDAALYQQGAGGYTAGNYGLCLHYLRSLDGAAIAERTVDEMLLHKELDENEQAELQETFTQIFPNVKDGDRICAVNIPAKEQVVFYGNGKPIGTLTGHEYAETFFDIWLGKATSEPEMRRQLLGK